MEEWLARGDSASAERLLCQGPSPGGFGKTLTMCRGYYFGANTPATVMFPVIETKDGNDFVTTYVSVLMSDGYYDAILRTSPNYLTCNDAARLPKGGSR
jgi:hypothetical protein